MMRVPAPIASKLGRELLLGVTSTAVAMPAALAAAEAAADSQLEGVVVTANKRSESTLEVPSTVNAISGAHLKQYGRLRINGPAAAAT